MLPVLLLFTGSCSRPACDMVSRHCHEAEPAQVLHLHTTLAVCTPSLPLEFEHALQSKSSRWGNRIVLALVTGLH